MTEENKAEEKQEEVQPDEAQEQVEAMDDLLTNYSESESTETTEEQEQESQPSEEEAGEQAETGEESEQEATEKKESKEDEPEKDSEVKLYEIPTKDGIKKVTEDDLKTTYLQHKNLQQKHLALKPILELAEQAGVPPELISQYLRYGVEMAQKGQQKEEPKGYEGPFENQEQDEYVKEADPTLYNSIYSQHNKYREVMTQNNNLVQEISGIKNRLNQDDQNDAKTKAIAQVDSVISDFTKQHTGFFDATEGSVDGFKGFLAENYPKVGHNQLDGNFLSIALSQYNPTYYQSFIMEQMKSKAEKKKQEENAAFGEGSGVRDASPTPKLSEQEEHMADVLSI